MYMQTYLVSTKRRSDLTDDDLVQQAQIAEPGAFEILFERYSAWIGVCVILREGEAMKEPPACYAVSFPAVKSYSL